MGELRVASAPSTTGNTRTLLRGRQAAAGRLPSPQWLFARYCPAAGSHRRLRWWMLPAWLCLAVGCTRTPVTTEGSIAAAAQATRATGMTSAREELDQIPPPSKSRYLAIHTVDGWSNPFLLVGKKTVTLRIYYPDAVANGTLPGGMLPNTMLRPAGARKRELDLRLADLPEALAALPSESWGYGRVVAVEEDPSTLRPDRVQMRRNVEATIQMLNDLGVVVNEWPQGGSLR